MNRLSIIILSTIVILTGCGETNIDNLKHQKLSFDSLPDTVRVIYESDIKKADTVFDYSIICTDKSIDFKQEHTGMDNGIWTLMTRGFNHHFYINRQLFKLKANQGDPFVLHNKHLYYTLELNLADYNYKQATYVSVDLSDYLSEHQR